MCNLPRNVIGLHAHVCHTSLILLICTVLATLLNTSFCPPVVVKLYLLLYGLWGKPGVDGWGGGRNCIVHHGPILLARHWMAA